MLFPTHLLAGYFIGKRWDLPVIWAIAGAALPDVVDKPLRMADITGLYQTIGHSLLVLVGSAVVILLGRNGLALWAGWASHLGLDALHMFINGRPDDIQFLAWPFINHEPAVQLPPVEFAVHYLGSPSFFVEVAMWSVFAITVVSHRESRTDSDGEG